MNVRKCFLLLFLLPATAWGQLSPGHPPISVSSFEAASTSIWTVFGRVTTVNGQPLTGVSVRVSAAAGTGPVRMLETNIKGEFNTKYDLDNKRYTKLVVDVLAKLPGYSEARDSAEFIAKEGTREFRLVLRDTAGQADQLSLEGLIGSLAPRFIEAAASSSFPRSVAKDFRAGLDWLFEKHDAVRAAPILRKVVEREPGCARCRVALVLGLLDLGSWANAQNLLLLAADPANQKTPSTDNGDSLLVLGVLDAWFGKPSTALGYFMKALERRPEDPLVLQEMGRALIDQKNWDAAEEHLARAIRAGARDEARALRIKALLEMGDTPEAESEMTTLVAGRHPRDLPAPLRMLHARLQERLQLQIYSSVKSFADQPLNELTRAVPELKGIEPATDQSPLTDLLRHVAASVDKFFHSLPNTISQEDIKEEILGRDGNIRDSRSEQFQYLLMFRADEVPLGLKEWRTRAEKLDVRAGALKGGFMRTAGFACVSLDFHANYQPGASFRLLGRQEIDGRPMDVVAFAQRPDKAQRIGRFDVDGRSVPVLVQGVAWIDSNTYQIIQMRTDLLKPPPNTRLKRQTTEIHFGEVRFKEISTPLWLPREVTVTVEWKGRTFRNFHTYSDFKVFKVETEEKRRAEGPREQENNHPAMVFQSPSKA